MFGDSDNLERAMALPIVDKLEGGETGLGTIVTTDKALGSAVSVPAVASGTDLVSSASSVATTKTTSRAASSRPPSTTGGRQQRTSGRSPPPAIADDTSALMRSSRAAAAIRTSSSPPLAVSTLKIRAQVARSHRIEQRRAQVEYTALPDESPVPEESQRSASEQGPLRSINNGVAATALEAEFIRMKEELGSHGQRRTQAPRKCERTKENQENE